VEDQRMFGNRKLTAAHRARDSRKGVVTSSRSCQDTWPNEFSEWRLDDELAKKPGIPLNALHSVR